MNKASRSLLWLLVLAAAGAGAGAFGAWRFAAAMPPVYEARAIILVQPFSTVEAAEPASGHILGQPREVARDAAQPQQLRMPDFEQLMLSDAVMTLAAARLSQGGAISPGSLRGSVRLQYETLLTGIYEVIYQQAAELVVRQPSPERAQEAAMATAQAAAEFVNAVLTDIAEEKLTLVDERLNRAKQRVHDLEQNLDGSTSQRRSKNLEIQLRHAYDEVAQWTMTHSAAFIAAQTAKDSARVVSEPMLPTAPSGLSRTTLLTLGALAGALCVFVILAVLAALKRSIELYHAAGA